MTGLVGWRRPRASNPSGKFIRFAVQFDSEAGLQKLRGKSGRTDVVWFFNMSIKDKSREEIYD